MSEMIVEKDFGVVTLGKLNWLAHKHFPGQEVIALVGPKSFEVLSSDLAKFMADCALTFVEADAHRIRVPGIPVVYRSGRLGSGIIVTPAANIDHFMGVADGSAVTADAVNP